MSPEDLKSILDAHAKWLRGEGGGERANLRGANLRDANLRDANLRGADLTSADLTSADLTSANLRDANLWRANLSGADLTSADLTSANLRDANLRDANLRGANLSGANLRGANLSGAELTGANLSGANLSGANLSGAELTGAKVNAFQIPQEGDLIVYKKVAVPRGGGTSIVKLRVTGARTATLTSRKCRCQEAVVLDGEGVSIHDPSFEYRTGATVRVEEYNPDPRIACAPGIHFFLTREEAEAWDGVVSLGIVFSWSGNGEVTRG